jgi:hypothetical protein
LKIKEIMAGLAAAGALVLLTAPAQAKTYDWTFSDGTYSGSGTLVTDPTNTYAVSGGGTVSGPSSFTDTLTLFPDPTPGVVNLSPDGNWLYDDSLPPDWDGFLFTGVSNSFYNLFSGGSGLGPTEGLLGFSNNGVSLYNGGNNIDGTLQLTAVPEPMTWALTLVGLFGMGAALRRLPRNQLSAVAAA